MNQLDFKPSSPLTLGVELEWQILNPDTGQLCNKSTRLLNAITSKNTSLGNYFKPEGMRTMIEINTRVHDTPDTLLTELYDFQAQVRNPLKELNLALSGGGTHPFETWIQSKVFPDRRYQKLYKIYGFLFKRFSVYGQHIHIGCESGKDALYLTHAFAPYVPHFIALSAASPFYLGVDTYFDCSRLTVTSAFPTSGVMPFITEWQEFEAHFQKLCQLRLINSIKDLYWDIRPKPEFGTVELRICDSPLTLKRATALGAYAQALASFLLDTRPSIDSEIYFPYQCNRFSAMRYGLNALIFNAKTKTEIPLETDILKTLKKIKPYAKNFKSVPFLEELEEICHTKNTDAQRTRAAYYKESNFGAVMQLQIQDWQSC